MGMEGMLGVDLLVGVWGILGLEGYLGVVLLILVVVWVNGWNLFMDY